MVDPSTITVYNASDNDLEELVLFWICAAGKNGRTAARCLDNLLADLRAWFSPKFSPFQLVRRADQFLDLPQWLKVSGIGCYNSKARSFVESANSKLDLRTCTPDDLETIHGIGMKTARCFVIHSRPGVRYAGLDTHILKHLRAKGIHNVPKSTPGSKKEYKRLEREVLKLADTAGMSPADYDLMIWNKYSVKSTPR